jgi:hypothetical protein
MTCKRMLQSSTASEFLAQGKMLVSPHDVVARAKRLYESMSVAQAVLRFVPRQSKIRRVCAPYAFGWLYWYSYLLGYLSSQPSSVVTR